VSKAEDDSKLEGTINQATLTLMADMFEITIGTLRTALRFTLGKAWTKLSFAPQLQVDVKEVALLVIFEAIVSRFL